MNHPVFFPYIFWDVVKHVHFFERISELGTKDGRQRLDRNEKLRVRRQPSAVIRRQSTAGHDEVDMGMVAHIPLPCVQSAHHADVSADEPFIFGQFLQGFCRRFEQKIIDHFLVRTGNGSQLRR